VGEDIQEKVRKLNTCFPLPFSAFTDVISLSAKEEMVWDFEIIYNTL
jgi:hypothetical protein